MPRNEFCRTCWHVDFVRTVEPDRPIEPLRASAEPLIGLEYWRTLVGADAAAPAGPGKPITVIDTGLDLTHEEFAGRPNTVPLGEQNLTDSEEDYHGTAVSSVAAAPENGLGIVGVYPQALLRSVDVGDLTVANVIAALSEAMRAGPSVINMSFGFGVPASRLLGDTVLTAFRTGSLLVASSGNERQEGTPAGPPGSLSHVLTVAATDSRNEPASFSTPSLGVDLAAPGVAIPGAVPRLFESSGYDLSLSGTSFSAPIVTGATAWVWTARPTLDNTQLFELMRMTATDVAEEGFDRDTGFGVLSIPTALTAPAPLKDPSEPNDDIRHVRAGGLFRAATAPITAPNRPRSTFRARLDVTEDPEDVYRVFVPAGRTLRITATPDTDVDVDVWKSSASSVFLRGTARTRNLLATSGKDGKDSRAGLGPQPHEDRLLRVPRRLPAAQRPARRAVHGHGRDRSTVAALYSTGGSSSTSGLRTRTRARSAGKRVSSSSATPAASASSRWYERPSETSRTATATSR